MLLNMGGGGQMAGLADRKIEPAGRSLPTIVHHKEAHGGGMQT